VCIVYLPRILQSPVSSATIHVAAAKPLGHRDIMLIRALHPPFELTQFARRVCPIRDRTSNSSLLEIPLAQAVPDA
jgi:hypothetical protein